MHLGMESRAPISLENGDTMQNKHCDLQTVEAAFSAVHPELSNTVIALNNTKNGNRALTP